MTTTIEAVYERGVLRLKEPVALADGTVVEVTITTSEPSGENKTPAEILSAIASLPVEGNGQPFSGRDHDKILYGEKTTRCTDPGLPARYCLTC